MAYERKRLELYQEYCTSTSRQGTGKGSAATRYFSTLAEEASSCQKRLAQDLASPQDSISCFRPTEKTHALATKTFFELMLTCWKRFLIETDQTVEKLLREIYGKINLWTLVRKFLTCQKTCLSFHGSLRVSASWAELFTDTSELLTDACDWLRVGHP